MKVLTFIFLFAAFMLSAAEKPNFVIIFTDDQGYQDVGCFGSPDIRTPNLDQMATEGMKFTNFYAQTVCGPSRAALMTGCYPLRAARHDNHPGVHPCLSLSEITLAEILKKEGYVTGCFGKWDLAYHKQYECSKKHFPSAQGFDFFFGTPSSNGKLINLFRNEEMIEEKADMAYATQRYTDEALQFIDKNKEKPFLVYIPHTMPHTRLDASPQFKGKSIRGLYGDVIEEIDFNVGRILKKIKELKLDKKTYVLFASDNGPWLVKKDHGGSALPLRSGKTSTWEGGLRVPCIFWGPGRIPAGTTSHEVASTLDVMPTFAKLAGSAKPTDRIIDGHDITALIHGEKNAKSPTEVFYYYAHTHLQAVRYGKWKLHVTRPGVPDWVPYAKGGHLPNQKNKSDITSPLLFNLETDIGEKVNVAAKHPEMVKKLLELVEKGRADIGDYNKVGAGARFEGKRPKEQLK